MACSKSTKNFLGVACDAPRTTSHKVTSNLSSSITSTTSPLRRKSSSLPSSKMSSSHTALSAAADDRKARLAKLKSLKRKQPDDESLPPEKETTPNPISTSTSQELQEGGTPDVAKLHLSGRNYDPEARGPKLGFEAPPKLDPEKQTLEEQAAEVEQEVKRKAAEDAQNDKGIDLFKLQPKKPNWDLKRDLDKKLEVLNVRTDNAIARLTRERILDAQKAKQGRGDGDGEALGVDGVTLLEGVRQREREEEEDERRDRADDE
jgi:coiled-coil domain-containing protein 12